MKAEELMSTDFLYANTNDSIEEISIRMEESKRFNMPVLNEDMSLIGWVTSLNVTKGLRENKKLISEVMNSFDEVVSVYADDSARLAILNLSGSKVFTLPVLNRENHVVGIIRSCTILEQLSEMYEKSVFDIYNEISQNLDITFDDLIDASTAMYRKDVGKEIKPEEYLKKIKTTTFGEAIWATGGLEGFFVGMIGIGEIAIAKKLLF
ncbi:MAG: CBS domain-containing protein [Methanobrevibacter sp.]|jgi:predicted transcriptional regulator|nr:CBS domain-containing protein [Candidatus Methanovirga aequatorialis]